MQKYQGQKKRVGAQSNTRQPPLCGPRGERSRRLPFTSGSERAAERSENALLGSGLVARARIWGGRDKRPRPLAQCWTRISTGFKRNGSRWPKACGGNNVTPPSAPPPRCGAGGEHDARAGGPAYRGDSRSKVQTHKPLGRPHHQLGPPAAQTGPLDHGLNVILSLSLNRHPPNRRVSLRHHPLYRHPPARSPRAAVKRNIFTDTYAGSFTPQTAGRDRL